jgi:hypothetical protein
MIKKVKGGYKVLSEKSKKNLGGPIRPKLRRLSACARWNISNTTKVRGAVTSRSLARRDEPCVSS